MPNIQPKLTLPADKPAQAPSSAPAANQAKSQEACPPVQGKVVEASQSKTASDSNQVKQGAQGKAQSSLSFDDISQKLEVNKAQVHELDKARQKADSAFKAQLAPIEAEIAQRKARLEELSHEIDSLWSLNPDEPAQAEPAKPEAAKPDPELELINKIKDPDVKLKMLRERADRLSKELDRHFEDLDLPEIKVIDSKDFK